jgi:predicted enzyme related to lactoylglutathione lyase
MARLGDIVFDCARPAPLARFWAAALDGYALAPYDDAEIERLRAMGIDDIEDDPGVLVEPPDGANGPRLFFQRVPEGKAVKNRVHLDLRCDDIEAEGARLAALGATVVRPAWDHEGGLALLLDPEGNEFCLSS